MKGQREVWTAIAASFDRTRTRPWPHVEAFLRALPEGSRVLDLMAGNGRHARLAQSLGLEVVAFDWVRDLVAKAPGGVVGDAVALPFADASFDAAIYAAGLHGLPTADARAASLRELRRVLRPRAPAQLTVWSRSAPRFLGLDLPPGPADITVPWRAEGHDEERFYHLYTLDELMGDAQRAGWAVEALGAVALASDVPDNLVAVLRA